MGTLAGERWLQDLLDGARWTGRVVARRRIEQSPLSTAPAVLEGLAGEVQDECEGDVYVDFGGRYGVVLCAWDELRKVAGNGEAL